MTYIDTKTHENVPDSMACHACKVKSARIELFRKPVDVYVIPIVLMQMYLFHPLTLFPPPPFLINYYLQTTTPNKYMATLIAASWKKDMVEKNPFLVMRWSTGTTLENAIDKNTVIRNMRYSLVSHSLKNGIMTPALPTIVVKII